MLFMVSGAGCQAGLRGDGALPARREQDLEVVGSGHGREAFEHIGEPSFGIVPVAHGVFQQGVQDGSALAGGLAANKEPVALSDGRWPKRVFEVVMPRPDLCRVQTYAACES
jgi:hypothetical protein